MRRLPLLSSVAITLIFSTACASLRRPPMPGFVERPALRTYASFMEGVATSEEEDGKLADAVESMEAVANARLESDGPESTEFGLAMGRLGSLYARVGKLQPAAEALRLSARALERSVGYGDPKVSDSLFLLAAVCLDLRDYECVEAHSGRALVIRENALGKSHPSVSDVLHVRALLLLEQHRDAEAEPLLVRALKIREDVHGREHGSLVTLLLLRSRILRARGEALNAEPMATRARYLAERATGPNDPRIIPALDENAEVCLHLAKYDCATEHYNQSLHLKKISRGESHPDVAIALSNIARVLDARLDFPNAETRHHDAIRVLKTAYGEASPLVAQAERALGVHYLNRHDPAQARAALERAFKILDGTEAGNGMDMASTLEWLARIHRNEDPHLGIKDLTRARDIKTAIHGPRHALVADTLIDLAFMELATDNVLDALSDLDAALAIRTEVFGENHERVARALLARAGARRALGDVVRAEADVVRAQQIITAGLGERAVQLAGPLTSLVLISGYVGEDARGLELANRLLLLEETAYGKDHPDALGTVDLQSSLHAARGEQDATRTLLDRGIAGTERAYGEQSAALIPWLWRRAVRADDSAKSVELCSRGLKILDVTHGGSRDDRVDLLRCVADGEEERGDLNAALRFNEEALKEATSRRGERSVQTAWALNALAYTQRLMGNHELAWTTTERSLQIQREHAGVRGASTAYPLRTLSEMAAQKGTWDLAHQHLSASSSLDALTTLDVATAGSMGLRRIHNNALTRNAHLALSMLLDGPAPRTEFTALAVNAILRRHGASLDLASPRLWTLQKRSDPAQRAELDAAMADQALLATVRSRGSDELSPADAAGLLAGLTARAEKSSGAAASILSERAALFLPVELAEIQAALSPDTALVGIVSYRTFDPTPVQHDRPFRHRSYAAAVIRHEGPPVVVSLGPAPALDALAQQFMTHVRDPASTAHVEPGRQLENRIFTPLRPALKGVTTLIIASDGGLRDLPWAALKNAKGKFLLQEFALREVTSARDLVARATPAASGNARWKDGAWELCTSVGVCAATQEETLRSPQAVELQGTLECHGRTPDDDVMGLGRANWQKDDPAEAGSLAAWRKTAVRDDKGHTFEVLDWSTLDLRGTALATLPACSGDTSSEGSAAARRALIFAGARVVAQPLWPVQDAAAATALAQETASANAGVSALRAWQLKMVEGKSPRHPSLWAGWKVMVAR